MSGDDQRAVVNQEVASPLVVGVEDAFGNPVPGVTVSWSIASGGGYFDASRSIPGQQTTSVTGGDRKSVRGALAARNRERRRLRLHNRLDALGLDALGLFIATADRGPVELDRADPGEQIGHGQFSDYRDGDPAGRIRQSRGERICHDIHQGQRPTGI